MALYTGNKTWEAFVYIIQTTDKIEFGVDGADSKPNVDLENRSTNLKKTKATIYISSGIPETGNPFNFALDTDTTNNTYYFNIDNGGFYKANFSGGTISSWENIQSNLKLNIPEININSGDENFFSNLHYNVLNERIDVLNQNDELISLKLKNIEFDTLDAFNKTLLKVSDSELLLKANIEQESENGDGSLTVKNYTGSGTGSEDNMSVTYDNSKERWTINSNLSILDIELENSKSNFYSDFFVTNQTQFDEAFSGTTIDSTYPYRNIVIKPGDYNLSQLVEIDVDNFSIVMQSGAKIIFQNSLCGFSILNARENISLTLNIDGDNQSITDLLDIGNTNYSNINLILLENINADNIINSSSSNSKNKISIVNYGEQSNNIVTNNISGIKNSFITGTYIVGSNTGGKTFDSCENLIINGFVNGLNFISNGDFDN